MEPGFVKSQVSATDRDLKEEITEDIYVRAEIFHHSINWKVKNIVSFHKDVTMPFSSKSCAAITLDAQQQNIFVNSSTFCCPGFTGITFQLILFCCSKKLSFSMTTSTAYFYSKLLETVFVPVLNMYFSI